MTYTVDEVSNLNKIYRQCIQNYIGPDCIDISFKRNQRNNISGEIFVFFICDVNKWYNIEPNYMFKEVIFVFTYYLRPWIEVDCTS